MIDPFGYSDPNRSYEPIAYTTVELPAKVTYVTGNPIVGCGLSLSTLILNSTTPPDTGLYDYISYFGLPTDISILIPAGTMDAYTSSTGWCNFSYYLIENNTPVTFSVNGNSYTIPKTMSWKDFVESEYNDGRFAFGVTHLETEY